VAQPSRLDEDSLRELLAELGPIRKVLARADITQKAKLYADLGLTMTFDPAENVVRVEAQPVCLTRVGGGT
jgi:hypothetical protein